MNAGTIRRKGPKQGLTSANYLAIELLDGRDSSYSRLDYIKLTKLN